MRALCTTQDIKTGGCPGAGEGEGGGEAGRQNCQSSHWGYTQSTLNGAWIKLKRLTFYIFLAVGRDRLLHGLEDGVGGRHGEDDNEVVRGVVV